MYGYSRRHRAVELVCITAVFLLLVAFGVRIAQTIGTARGWIHLVLTLLTSYLAADLISGVVHWMGDTVGDERVPFLGPNFIRPFREHHVDPKAITHHDFIETNGNNCIVTVVPLAAAFVLAPGDESFWFFTSVFVASVSLFVVATNQFHKWAHADDPPRFARALQRLGLVLPPHHHDIHHARPHDKHYCITVGWLNPLLNGVRFFRIAEWLIARVRPALLHVEERKRVAAELAAIAAARAEAGGGNAPGERPSPTP